MDIPLNKSLNLDLQPVEMGLGSKPYGKNWVYNTVNNSITSEEGFTHILTLGDSEFFLGVIAIPNGYILFTKDKANKADPIDHIYKYINDLLVKDIKSRKLNLTESRQINGEYIFNYKNELTICFSEGTDPLSNETRFLNVDTAKSSPEWLEDEVGIISKINLIPNMRLPKVEAKVQNGGGCLSGAYQFGIAYDIGNGSYTDCNIVTPVVYITNNNASMGVKPKVSVNKKIELTLYNLDSNFSKYRLYVIYKSEADPDIKYIDDITINTIKVTIDNISTYKAGTMEELTAKHVSYIKCEGLTNFQGTLLQGNVCSVDYGSNTEGLEMSAKMIADNTIVLKESYALDNETVLNTDCNALLSFQSKENYMIYMNLIDYKGNYINSYPVSINRGNVTKETTQVCPFTDNVKYHYIHNEITDTTQLNKLEIVQSSLVTEYTCTVDNNMYKLDIYTINLKEDDDNFKNIYNRLSVAYYDSKYNDYKSINNGIISENTTVGLLVLGGYTTNIINNTIKNDLKLDFDIAVNSNPNIEVQSISCIWINNSMDNSNIYWLEPNNYSYVENDPKLLYKNVSNNIYSTTSGYLNIIDTKTSLKYGIYNLAILVNYRIVTNNIEDKAELYVEGTIKYNATSSFNPTQPRKTLLYIKPPANIKELLGSYSDVVNQISYSIVERNGNNNRVITQVLCQRTQNRVSYENLNTTAGVMNSDVELRCHSLDLLYLKPNIGNIGFDLRYIGIKNFPTCFMTNVSDNVDAQHSDRRWLRNSGDSECHDYMQGAREPVWAIRNAIENSSQFKSYISKEEYEWFWTDEMNEGGISRDEGIDRTTLLYRHLVGNNISEAMFFKDTNFNWKEANYNRFREFNNIIYLWDKDNQLNRKQYHTKTKNTKLITVPINVKNIQYIAANNIALNNLFGESHYRIELDGSNLNKNTNSLDELYEMFFLHGIADIVNMNSEFYVEENPTLTLASSIYQIEDINANTKIPLQGDTFISDFTIRITYPGCMWRVNYETMQSEDKYVVKIIVGGNLESRFNLAARYSGTGDNEQVYISKYYNDHLDSDIEDKKGWAFNVRPNIDNFIKTDIGEGYNTCFNWNGLHLDTIVKNLGENTVSTLINRIIRSDKTNPESLILGWQKFQPDSYYDVPLERGKIVNLQADTTNLYIQQEYALRVASVKDTLSGDAEAAYVGSGDLFDRYPQEVIFDKNGYIGCRDKFMCFISPVGYVVLDSTKGKVFIVNGNKPQEITLTELRRWAEKEFNHKLGEPLIASRFYGNSYTGIYDTKYNRLLLGRRGGQGMDESFMLDYGMNYGWGCFHEYYPDYMFANRQGHYLITNNSLYKGNKSEVFCKFFDEMPLDTVVQLVFNVERTVDKLLDVLAWQTIVEWNGRYIYDKTVDEIMVHNDTQCTGLITVDLNQEWFSTEKGIGKSSKFLFNKIDDAVIDDTKSIISNYYIPDKVNVDYDKKDFWSISNIIGSYAVITLVYHNQYYNHNNNTWETISGVVSDKRQANFSIINVELDVHVSNRIDYR